MLSARWLLAALVACASVGASLGCREPAATCVGEAALAPEPACGALRLERPLEDVNVILIVDDTLRSDRLRLYGGTTTRTPAFDAFAEENVYFEHAFAQAPWTKPSVATLFTSLFPSQHHMVSHPELRESVGLPADAGPLQTDRLADGVETLAEVMQRGGFRTAAFISNPWMTRGFGFEQGFDHYDDSLARWHTPGEQVTRAALTWLDSLEPGERFFAYVHYIDTHRPYGRLSDESVRGLHLEKPSSPLPDDARDFYQQLLRDPGNRLSPATRAQLVEVGPNLALLERAYDLGVEEFDRALGQFLAAFSGHPAYARTVIIVTSDHGEALFARGYGNHGTALYDDELSIPMAVRLPGATATATETGPRIGCAVGLIDVMPTLCESLGLECPEPMFGRSFVEVAGRERPDAAWVVSEGVMFRPGNRAVRNRCYKLIWEPQGSRIQRDIEFALYDVARDPGERRDLMAPDARTPEHQSIGRELARAMRDAVPEYEASPREVAPVDPTTRRRLEELGYLD